MQIRQNLHIHSQHSCDSACASLLDIRKEMLDLGMTEFGLSDHFHTRYNMCDIQSAANDFKCTGHPDFHFGVEVSCVSDWECDKIARNDYLKLGEDPVYGIRAEEPPHGIKPCIDLTAEDIEQNNIEYVIGGVHWPLYAKSGEDCFRDYFDQMIHLVENPLVDILAHPWAGVDMAYGGWFQYRDKEHITPEALLHIPQEFNDKLLDALLKHNKCAEINLSSLFAHRIPENILKHCWERLANWREAGVKFVIGSDQHAAHSVPGIFAAAGLLLDKYGFTDDDIRYFFTR